VDASSDGKVEDSMNGKKFAEDLRTIAARHSSEAVVAFKVESGPRQRRASIASATQISGAREKR
jgi:hypothetical protein